MMNEEFDELIRRKLESEAGFPAAHSDVSRVLKYVRRKKGFPVKGGFSRWWYFIVPVAAVITYFAIVRNDSEPKSVLKPKQETALPADSSNNAKPVQKNETVDKTEALSNPEIQPIRTSVPSSNAGQLSGVKVKAIENRDQIQMNSENVPASDFPFSEKHNKFGVEEKTSEIIDPVVVAKPAEAKAGMNIQIPETVNPADDVKNVKPLENDFDKVSESPIVQNPDTGTNEINQTKHRTQNKLKIKPFGNNGLFKKTNEGEFKAGITTGLSLHSYGFGLDVYRSVLKNTGIHAGFHYTIFQPEHFSNREDFDLHHKHGRPPKFDEHLHGDEMPVDIVVNNRALQFNTGVSHYFRLKNNYSILLALGTNMDVKLWQTLNYGIENDSVQNLRHSFLTPEKATAFNNIYLTTGLEKSWRNWSFQLQPYLGYQFRSPGYRRFTWEPGIGASVFYVFGR